MSTHPTVHDQRHQELVSLYALRALPPNESGAAEAQIAACRECRGELEKLRPIVGAFVGWPTNLLRPPTSLWDRLSQRISAETGTVPLPEPSAPHLEPEWDEVAPGISVRILATDTERHRVSMLVRLAPGTAYPPHRHAGVEELHLLDGELWIEDRLLRPGDYNLGQAGGTDQRVYSETGCTCVLITSLRDEIL